MITEPTLTINKDPTQRITRNVSSLTGTLPPPEAQRNKTSTITIGVMTTEITSPTNEKHSTRALTIWLLSKALRPSRKERNSGELNTKTAPRHAARSPPLAMA
jgi:hypothetical protein